MDACGRKKDVFDMMDLRNVLWEGIFKLSASAASEFCEWVQVAIDIYIYILQWPPSAGGIWKIFNAIKWRGTCTF